MKYALFVCGPDGGDPVPRAGEGVGGVRLRPAEDATTVRLRDGEVVLGDGPLDTGTGRVVGIDLIDVADLDDAVGHAARHPAVRRGGAVEVRPVWT